MSGDLAGILPCGADEGWPLPAACPARCGIVQWVQVTLSTAARLAWWDSLLRQHADREGMQHLWPRFTLNPAQSWPAGGCGQQPAPVRVLPRQQGLAMRAHRPGPVQGLRAGHCPAWPARAGPCSHVLPHWRPQGKRQAGLPWWSCPPPPSIQPLCTRREQWPRMAHTAWHAVCWQRAVLWRAEPSRRRLVWRRAAAGCRAVLGCPAGPASEALHLPCPPPPPPQEGKLAAAAARCMLMTVGSLRASGGATALPHPDPAPMPCSSLTRLLWIGRLSISSVGRASKAGAGIGPAFRTRHSGAADSAAGTVQRIEAVGCRTKELTRPLCAAQQRRGDGRIQCSAPTGGGAWVCPRLSSWRRTSHRELPC